MLILALCLLSLTAQATELNYLGLSQNFQNVLGTPTLVQDSISNPNLIKNGDFSKSSCSS